MSTLHAPIGSVVVPTTDEAAARQAELINRARAGLLTSGTAATFEQIATATGKRSETVRKAIQRRQQGGGVIAVVHAGVTYMPTFQLDEAFEVDESACSVVQRLTAAGMSAWAVWRWATTANSWLLGDTPADRLAEGDVAAVHAAADGLLQT